MWDGGASDDWDEAAPMLLFPVDVAQAREKRAAELERFQHNLLSGSALVSGHTLHLNILSASFDGGHILLDVEPLGLVQRPEAIAVPERGLIKVKIPCRVTRTAELAAEQEPDHA